jgi:hypothetical protein
MPPCSLIFRARTPRLQQGYRRHLKQELAHRRGGDERLLIEVQGWLMDQCSSWRTMSLRRLVAFALLCLLPYTGKAADVSVIAQATADHPALILVKGQLVKGDDVKFVSAIADVQTSAVVFLDSPGGIVFAGLQIGRIIRRHGFATAVTDDTQCTSACAIAWMGGKQRFMGFRARIGFHAARAPNQDQIVIASVTNGKVAAYYSEMGVADPATITALTTTPPQEMRWLSINDGHMLIGYTIFSLSERQWAWARSALNPQPVMAFKPPPDLQAYALHKRKFTDK